MAIEKTTHHTASPDALAQSQNAQANAATPAGHPGGFTEIDFLAQTSGAAPPGRTMAVRSMPPPQPTKEPGATAAHVEELGACIGIDLYTFMALAQKLAQNMRNLAREQRTAAWQDQTGKILDSAAHMKEAAYDRFYAGVIQGTVQMGASLGQMYYASKALGQGLESADLKAQAGGAKGQEQVKLTKDSEIQAAMAEYNQSLVHAAGGLPTGLGTVLSSFFTLKAGLEDATSKELEAGAKTSETAAQQANDFMQQMLEVLRDIRDKLASIDQSTTDTNRKMASV